jgi:hypothetical protein
MNVKALYVLVVFTFLLPAAQAQHPVSFSDEIVLYRGERFMPYIDGSIEVHSSVHEGLSRQQQRLAPEMLDKVTAVAEILKYCPFLRPPQGIKVVIKPAVLPPSEFNESTSLIGNLKLEFFVTMVCNEKPCYDKITDASFTLAFNEPLNLAAVHIMDDIWVQPRKVSEFHGFPVYRLFNGRREATVVHANNIPLYLPVSREDFIMNLIRHFSEIIAEDERLAATPDVKKSLVGFSDAEARERFAHFENEFKRLNRFDPLLARKLKENFELVEKRLGLARTDSSVVISQNQYISMQLSVWKEGIRKLRAELNAMSPSERRSQAHWSESEVLNTSGLTPPGHPGSNPVARINPAVLDNSRPETNIQLITLEWNVDTAPFATFRQGRNLQYHRLHELSLWETGWQSIFKLLDQVPVD